MLYQGKSGNPDEGSLQKYKRFILPDQMKHEANKNRQFLNYHHMYIHYWLNYKAMYDFSLLMYIGTGLKHRIQGFYEIVFAIWAIFY
jgi:hypothetical protein